MTEKMSTNDTEAWSRYAKYYDPLKIGSIDGTDTEPHDKAIVRAISSEYKPNKHVKGRPSCTIFVSRLSPRTTKDTINELFSKFGRLKRFRLVKDIVTGFPKGYAFIEYESESDAEEAYRKAYKMNVDGNVIFVDFECERLLKGWKPRRLGGGFGGMKESGQLRFGCRDRPFRKPIRLEINELEETETREKERDSNNRKHYDCGSADRERRDKYSHERDIKSRKSREKNINRSTEYDCRDKYVHEQDEKNRSKSRETDKRNSERNCEDKYDYQNDSKRRSESTSENDCVNTNDPSGENCDTEHANTGVVDSEGNQIKDCN